MSKIRNMSRRGSFILVASIAAVLLVPTAVWAATTYNGIKGVSGVKANVDPFGDLQVVTPPNLLESGQVNPGGSWGAVVGGGFDKVVTSLNVDTWVVSPGGSNAIQFGISENGCASVSQAIEAVNPGGIGETAVDLGSGGLSLDSTQTLCAINDDPTNLHAAVFALTRQS